MAIPQLGTPLGSLFITAFLWFWTLKRARAHVSQQEVLLRQQNRSASWGFLGCMCLQLMSLYFSKIILFKLFIGLSCSFLFLFFILRSSKRSEGFWSKKRNQFIVSLMAFSGLSILPFVIKDLYLIPVITALLIANICQERFVQLFSNSLRDLEALQAKLLRQEAAIHNERTFKTQNPEKQHYGRAENAIESRA